MKKLLILLTLSLPWTFALAQNINKNKAPICAVFEYKDQYGIVDTSGQEIVPLGKYNWINKEYGLQYYLIRKQENDKEYSFFDATTGKEFSLGYLKNTNEIKFNNENYFHIINSNKSELISPLVAQKYTFDKSYYSIKSLTLYKDSSEIQTNFFITEDNEYFYKFWRIDDTNLPKSITVPKSKNYELIYSEINEDHYTTIRPVGIAIILPSPTVGSKAKYAAVYNSDFKLLGKTTLNDANLKKLFKYDAMSQQSYPKHISAGSGILLMTGNDHSVDFNESFAIKRMDKNLGNGYWSQKYYYAKRIGDKYEDILQLEYGCAHYVRQGDKMLVQLRVPNKNKMTFIIDYNGYYFPKGKVMIPYKYLEQEQLKSLYPYAIGK